MLEIRKHIYIYLKSLFWIILYTWLHFNIKCFSFLFSDIAFLFCFILQTSAGVLLNYSLFLCTEKNSALTTSLIGVLKSILQTVIGFFTFGGIEFNFLNIFGISLNMFGGILYTYIKYQEKKKCTSDSVHSIPVS